MSPVFIAFSVSGQNTSCPIGDFFILLIFKFDSRFMKIYGRAPITRGALETLKAFLFQNSFRKRTLLGQNFTKKHFLKKPFLNADR